MVAAVKSTEKIEVVDEMTAETTGFVVPGASASDSLPFFRPFPPSSRLVALCYICNDRRADFLL